MDFAEKIKTIWFMKSWWLERKNEQTIHQVMEHNEKVKKEKWDKALEHIVEQTNKYMWQKNNT